MRPDHHGVGLREKAPPASAAIRVHIVAEVRLYRDGLQTVLDAEDKVEVSGASARGDGCVERIADERPDVVLLDMETPGSLELIPTIRRAAPGARVVALAVPDDERDVVACAEAGVSGYVTRDQSIDDVVASIESVARGEMVCSPRLAATLLRRVTALAAERTPAPLDARLTSRELEIIALIDHGLSNKQIARQLCIEVATVKNHVHNILEKLHVNRRNEAVARVQASGVKLPRRLDEGLPEI